MKIKGHTSIILTDVKTGKVERHEDDNLITNAIQNYIKSCGFMNYPNVNVNNLVVQLLGGIMAFDDEIPESVSIVHVPAGLKMIANGSVNTVNNGAVLELGSYSSTESGWQTDGSYVQTYDYTTSQANGTIKCVCLTGQTAGYVGAGNSLSLTRHTSRISPVDLSGTTSNISVDGYMFCVDVEDSTCYTFKVEERINDQDEAYTCGVIRKYRVPLTKLNLKNTLLNPILLTEQEVTLDNDLIFAATTMGILRQPLNNKLIIWNLSGKGTAGGTTYNWGDGFTQYVWEITKNGIITKSTVVNTTGDSLLCLADAVFDGDYCIFPKAYRDSNDNNLYIDPKILYIMNRNTGVITRVENLYNNSEQKRLSDDTAINYREDDDDISLNILYSSGDGRVTTCGSYPVVIDAVKKEIYPNNARTDDYRRRYGSSSPLIRFVERNNAIFRDQGYIASINNLDTPVVKTAEKTMKIIYRLTFEDV